MKRLGEKIKKEEKSYWRIKKRRKEMMEDNEVEKED